MPPNHAQEHETTRKASSKFWKRCFQLVLIMILPVGFLAWISLFRDTPLEISKKTTLITEPLTSDGTRVDYFRALELKFYPPTMKTDDNGYRLIVRALGPYFKEPDLAAQVYEKLGLDPNIPPTMKYEDPYKFLKSHPEAGLSEEDLESKISRPWTLKELPMMADWLDQNGPALDMFAEAVRKPSFHRPWTRHNEKTPLVSIYLDDVQELRTFARGLAARANYRISTGDIDGAIDDIITCKKLGRHIKDGCLVESMVGVAIETIANSIDIAGSLEHQPTEAQLQRLMNELDSLPPRGTLENSMTWEQYWMLDMVQILASKDAPETKNLCKSLYGPGDEAEIMAKIVGTLGFDWNTVISHANTYYDDPSKIELLCGRYHSKLSPYLTPALLLPTSRSEILGDIIIGLFFPATDAAQEAFNRTRCSDQLQKITLAMLLYEKQHGRLPPGYTVDKDGKPLHSWRVLLLPYLGEKAKKLHAKIKLDEPWDSKHNRQFHDAAVDFYRCPSAKLKPGETTYSVVLGKKTAFQPGEGKKLDQFGPNSANLILATESNTPGCWMDPTFNLTESDTTTMLGPHTTHSGIIRVGLRSGSVHSVSPYIEPKIFQNGLEGTETDWYEER